MTSANQASAPLHLNFSRGAAIASVLASVAGCAVLALVMALVAGIALAEGSFGPMTLAVVAALGLLLWLAAVPMRVARGVLRARGVTGLVIEGNRLRTDGPAPQEIMSFERVWIDRARRTVFLLAPGITAVPRGHMRPTSLFAPKNGVLRIPTLLIRNDQDLRAWALARQDKTD